MPSRSTGFNRAQEWDTHETVAVLEGFPNSRISPTVLTRNAHVSAAPALPGSPLKRKRAVPNLNARFDRMIEQVGLVSRAETRSPPRRRRIYSSGSSSISSDMPKTPRDAHSGLNAGLGKGFSVLKLKEASVRAAYRRTDGLPGNNDATEPVEEDGDDGSVPWKGEPALRVQEPVPDWLNSALSTLQPEHPLRRLMPSLKPQSRLSRVDRSARRAHEAGLQEAETLDPVFAFQLPGTHDPPTSPLAATQSPVSTWITLPDNATPTPSPQTEDPLLFRPPANSEDAEQPPFDAEDLFVSTGGTSAYIPNPLLAHSPLPNLLSNGRVASPMGLSSVPFSAPGPASHMSVAQPRQLRKTVQMFDTLKEDPVPDLSYRSLSRAEHHHLPQMGPRNLASTFGNPVSPQVALSRPTIAQSILKSHLGSAQETVALRSPIHTPFDYGQPFLDTKPHSMQSTKIVRFNSHALDSADGPTWQPFSKPGPLVPLRSPCVGRVSVTPDVPQPLTLADDEELHNFNFLSSPVPDNRAHHQDVTHQRATQRTPNPFSTPGPAYHAPPPLYFASPTEDPSSSPHAEPDVFAFCPDWNDAMAPPKSSQRDPASQELQLHWSALIHGDDMHLGDVHLVPEHVRDVGPPHSHRFSTPKPIGTVNSVTNALSDVEEGAEQGWAHVVSVRPGQRAGRFEQVHVMDTGVAEEEGEVNAFAPAPGIFVSPLKGEDAEREVSPWVDEGRDSVKGAVVNGKDADKETEDEIEDVVGVGGSQASEHDSIESWST